MDFFGFNTSGLLTGVSTFVQFLVYMAITLTITALAWGCTYLLSFKTIVQVRQQTASGYVITHTKARQFRTRDKVLKWRLLNDLKKTHVPPATDFLSLTKKGKFYALADKSITGTLTWRKLGATPDNPDEFTSEERTIQVIENRRADEYKKKSNMDKILALAPSLIVVMILVIVLAFWGNFVESTTKASDKVALASDRLAVASDRLAVAIQGWNDVNGLVNVNGTYFGDVPPPTNIPN